MNDQANYRPRPAERELLRILHQLGPEHHSTLDELAHAMNVTSRTISNLLRKLKKVGLIEVSASRREHWRKVTTKGEEAL